jgi:hypothetical protein
MIGFQLCNVNSLLTKTAFFHNCTTTTESIFIGYPILALVGERKERD